MYQSQFSEYGGSVQPAKNTINFTNKNKGTNFASFSGVNPARSLHSPSTSALISSLKGKGEESLKHSTDSKYEAFKGSLGTPERNYQMFEPTTQKTFDGRKSSGDGQPIFEFKPRNQTSKRADNVKMDNINNALELYMEKKKLNSNKASFDTYTKPVAQFNSTYSTKQEQNNASNQYGIESINKQFHFKKSPTSERSDSNTKTRSARISSMFPVPGNRTPCLNDFVVGKKLGKGKFGEVFLVKHKHIGFICAMKVLSKTVIKQSKLQNQLTREIMIQLYLSNPNIVQMYGMFTQNDNVYLLLEPCLDGHLLTELKKKKRFDQEEASNILRQVLQGVDIMHRCSVIHRDLKPQNICIHEGVCKISDFGWAVYSPDSLRQTFCGTPLYMSPQLLTGQQYTQSVDIWAIGMLAYELLVGRLPFKVQKSQQLSKIITDNVEFPQHAQVSASAQQFVLTLLKKDPKQRVDIDDLFGHPFLLNKSE